MIPSVQPCPCQADVDMNCSKWGCWGTRNPRCKLDQLQPHITNCPNDFVCHWEREKEQGNQSQCEGRAQDPLLCSFALPGRSWDRKEKEPNKSPWSNSSDSGLPVRHLRNLPNAIRSTLHYHKFSSASPSLSFYSKGDKKIEVLDFCNMCPSFQGMGGGRKQGVSATP